MKTKWNILLIAVLILLCGCGSDKNDENEKVLSTIENYQEAINTGDLESADTYCDLENEKVGTRIFYEQGLEIKDDDSNFITAIKTIYRESISIQIEKVEIDGDDEVATVYATVSQCDLERFINGISENYDFDDLLSKTVEECKELYRKDIGKYMLSFNCKIICKKIDDVWKIVDYRE